MYTPTGRTYNLTHVRGEDQRRKNFSDPVKNLCRIPLPSSLSIKRLNPLCLIRRICIYRPLQRRIQNRRENFVIKYPAISEAERVVKRASGRDFHEMRCVRHCRTIVKTLVKVRRMGIHNRVQAAPPLGERSMRCRLISCMSRRFPVAIRRRPRLCCGALYHRRLHHLHREFRPFSSHSAAVRAGHRHCRASCGSGNRPSHPYGRTR